MSDQSEILDLDALMPAPKKVSLRGKVLEVYPISVRQLVSIVKLQDELANVKNIDEILPKIKDTLSPFMPAIKDDPDFDIAIPQILAIIEYAQSSSIPTQATQAKQYPVQKKRLSAEESPTLSDSTPATK